MSIWDYLIKNIFGKIQNIFENDTENQHGTVGKIWGKNKWKLLLTETFKRLVWAVSNMDNARKSMPTSSGYLVVIFLHYLTQLKAKIRETLKI